MTRARDKVSSALADAAGDAASALASVHSGAAPTATSAQASLAKANSDYTHFLGIETAGKDHALPGGNATGARVRPLPLQDRRF